jgi:hypothetical protein
MLGCNISRHVKVMAAASVIEEAPEPAKDRREWWWRKTNFGARELGHIDTGAARTAGFGSTDDGVGEPRGRTAIAGGSGCPATAICGE